MVQRFFKKKPYSLLLVKADENGDPYTLTVNVSFKERTQEGSLVFRSMCDCITYIVHKDRFVYYTDGEFNKRCECANIVHGWQW